MRSALAISNSMYCECSVRKVSKMSTAFCGESLPILCELLEHTGLWTSCGFVGWPPDFVDLEDFLLEGLLDEPSEDDEDDEDARDFLKCLLVRQTRST